MFLLGALFGLVTVGVVVPCLIDVAVTPDREVRHLNKLWWVLLLVFLSAIGAAAWLVAGRPRRRTGAYWSRAADSPYFTPQDAIRRHPAGRAMDGDYEFASGRAVRAGAIPARPTGPDDDPDFLEELARRIRGGDQAGSDT
jgi:Phospholipase_D-nuclease N-terminal